MTSWQKNTKVPQRICLRTDNYFQITKEIPIMWIFWTAESCYRADGCDPSGVSHWERLCYNAHTPATLRNIIHIGNRASHVEHKRSHQKRMHVKVLFSPMGSACLWRWSNSLVLLENMLPHVGQATSLSWVWLRMCSLSRYLILKKASQPVAETQRRLHHAGETGGTSVWCTCPVAEKRLLLLRESLQLSAFNVIVHVTVEPLRVVKSALRNKICEPKRQQLWSIVTKKKKHTSQCSHWQTYPSDPSGSRLLLCTPWLQLGKSGRDLSSWDPTNLSLLW